MEIALGDDVHPDQEVDVRPEFLFQDGNSPHCRATGLVGNPYPDLVDGRVPLVPNGTEGREADGKQLKSGDHASPDE